MYVYRAHRLEKSVLPLLRQPQPQVKPMHVVYAHGAARETANVGLPATHHQRRRLFRFLFLLRFWQFCFEICAASSSEYFGLYRRMEENDPQEVCACGGTEGFLENFEDLEVGTCDNDCSPFPNVPYPDEACGGWRSEDGESADMAIYRLSDDVPGKTRFLSMAEIWTTGRSLDRRPLVRHR